MSNQVEVPDLTKVEVILGSIKHLPPMKDIPEEFQKYHGTKWNKIMSKWFYGGLPGDTEFIPKEGVDAKKAIAALGAILASFEPKHEHKEAGVAYLMSQWFEDIVVPSVPGDAK